MAPRKKINTRKGWRKIQFSADRMGNIIMCPVDKGFKARIKRYMRDEGYDKRHDGCVFAQEGFGASEVRGMLRPANRRDLDEGYNVVQLMDPWEFLHWVGYDAHRGVKL